MLIAIAQMMNVNKFICFVLITFLSTSCKQEVPELPIWKNGNSSFLFINSNDLWQIFNSEDATLCTSLRQTKKLEKGQLIFECVTDYCDFQFSTANEIHVEKTVELIKINGAGVFRPVPYISWDSITIETRKGNSIKSTKESYSRKSDYLELLSLMIVDKEYLFVNPTNVANDDIIQYKLWNNGTVIKSKTAGSKNICLSLD